MTSSDAPIRQEPDVAISFLWKDRKHAEKIRAELPDDLDVFVASERQSEIKGRAGAEVFARAFRVARMCIVLYRDAWGTKSHPWTALEHDVIRGRYKEGERSFFLFVKFDEPDELPSWVPQDHLWCHWFSDRTGGIARTVEDNLRELEKGKNSWGRVRVTRRTFRKETLPVSYYQQEGLSFSFQVFTPADRSEACDDCTGKVQFRPLIRVKLRPDALDEVVEEQFCPACAEKRGFRVDVPPPFDADKEPSLRKYLKWILGERVLKILSGDEDLSKLGIDHVGAAIGHTEIGLMPSASDPDIEEISVPYHEIKKAGAFSEFRLSNFLKNRIMNALDGQ